MQKPRLKNIIDNSNLYCSSPAHAEREIIRFLSFRDSRLPTEVLIKEGGI